MCGIAGIVDAAGLPDDSQERVLRMLASIRHRGPDQHGVLLDDTVALGSVRLSIVDVGHGQQPIANEDGSVWIVLNGEVFNHVELRPGLEARGHVFRTRTDTEVILHLYEEMGPACLGRLNGQFALAIWDARRRSLLLARDRLGVRPLFHTARGGRFLFGSEIKALLNGLGESAAIDPGSLCDVFTYWSALPGRSVFAGIEELPPGHCLEWRDGRCEVRRYWEFNFEAAADRAVDPADILGRFEELLVDAARIRLRADVPVGAYLSGGLDSSTIAAVVRNFTTSPLRTFSIAFTDGAFDEREHQQRMAEFLGTEHEVVEATHADIGAVFPEVVWHMEIPTLRTSPAPMLLLSRLVRRAGLKVVLTGEGADEFLGGYDIFKEAKVRAFWAREPDARRRPLLLQRLYPEIFAGAPPGGGFLAAFFGAGLADVDAGDYSHALRWRNTRRAWRFLRPEVAAAGRASALAGLEPWLPAGFRGWGVLERAQAIEATLFLPQFLLSSQGDRMGMASAVEGRFPFLDHRLVEFCSRLPSRLKLRGLREKHLLRELAGRWLPPEIACRRKRPYRAPIHRSFFHERAPAYVRELLDEPALRRSGLFNPGVVAQLVAKLQRGRGLGETDDMALAGVLSTQLLHAQFVADFRRAQPLPADGGARCCRVPGIFRSQP